MIQSIPKEKAYSNIEHTLVETHTLTTLDILHIDSHTQIHLYVIIKQCNMEIERGQNDRERLTRRGGGWVGVSIG